MINANNSDYTQIIQATYKNGEIFQTSWNEFIIKMNSKIRANDFLHLFESMLIKQIFDYGKLQYLILKKTNEFPNVGEISIATSFHNALFKTPIDANFGAAELQILHQEIINLEHERSWSIQDMKKELDNFSFNFGGLKINPIEDNAWVNAILKWLNSENGFISHRYALTGIIMYFGKLKCIRSSKLEDSLEHKSFLLENELARTPFAHLSIAGHNFEDTSVAVLRKIVFERIFLNKWISHLKDESYMFWRNLNDCYNIRIKIKERVLEAYHISNLEELKNSKEFFLNEMIDCTVWHELGHTISISMKVNPKLKPYHQGLIPCLGSDTNYTAVVIKEAMADYAVEVNSHCGPILMFCKLGETHYDKAQRIIYVYISDYWHLDGIENFMSRSTDIILSLLMPFLDMQGEFDYKKLNTAHPEIHNFLVNEFIDISDKLLLIFEKGEYQVGDNYNCSFDIFKKELAGKLLPLLLPSSNRLEDLDSNDFFWQNIFSESKKLSPDTYHKAIDCLNNHSEHFEKRVIQFLKKWDESITQFSRLRDYLVASMKRKHFFHTS